MSKEKKTQTGRIGPKLLSVFCDLYYYKGISLKKSTYKRLLDPFTRQLIFWSYLKFILTIYYFNSDLINLIGDITRFPKFSKIYLK